jgi:hypothetical protein
MDIGIVISKNGREIRLTAERWAHIVEAHDYMAGNQDLVFETVENPDHCCPEKFKLNGCNYPK